MPGKPPSFEIGLQRAWDHGFIIGGVSAWLGSMIGMWVLFWWWCGG